MATQKMLVCPACKSKNVIWRGIEGAADVEAAGAATERMAKWECADCGNTFTIAQAAPPPAWRRS